MVKITVAGTSWTGVMIDSRGLILTPSSNLGTAPVAAFITRNGSNGRAWVVGRDDNLDLALLEVINPGQEFDAITIFEGNAPGREAELAMLQFPSAGTVLNTRNTQVVGSRQDITGIDYIQLQAFPTAGSQGGAIIDNLGRLRALRMADAHIFRLGIGRAGETWGIDGKALSQLVVPQLQSGVSVINAPPDGRCTNIGRLPGIPAIFKGDIMASGVPVAEGARPYARVTLSGKELWFSQIIGNAGRYFITISICGTTFNNANVDFWLNAEQAPQTSIYVAGRTTDTPLTFP